MTECLPKQLKWLLNGLAVAVLMVYLGNSLDDDSSAPTWGVFNFNPSTSISNQITPYGQFRAMFENY